VQVRRTLWDRWEGQSPSSQRAAEPKLRLGFAACCEEWLCLSVQLAHLESGCALGCGKKGAAQNFKGLLTEGQSSSSQRAAEPKRGHQNHRQLTFLSALDLRLGFAACCEEWLCLSVHL